MCRSRYLCGRVVSCVQQVYCDFVVLRRVWFGIASLLEILGDRTAQTQKSWHTISVKYIGQVEVMIRLGFSNVTRGLLLH